MSEQTTGNFTEGTATIIATDGKGNSDQCEVTVRIAHDDGGTGTISPFLFSDFDEENHTVSVAGLIDTSGPVNSMIIPKEIIVKDKVPADTSKKTYLVLESKNGEKYTVNVIKNNAFTGNTHISGELTLPDSLLSIESVAFGNCQHLSGSLIIPNSVASLGHNAFLECTRLTHLTLSNSLASIPDKAFCICQNLAGLLVIPDSVSTIGQNAFSHCTNLEELEIGSGITEIMMNGFYNCQGIKTITIHKPQNSIIGAPWGAVNATVNWVG